MLLALFYRVRSSFEYFSSEKNISATKNRNACDANTREIALMDLSYGV
jgi:hypothetical protein